MKVYVFCGDTYRQARCACGWQGPERQGLCAPIQTAVDGEAHMRAHPDLECATEYVYQAREYWSGGCQVTERTDAVHEPPLEVIEAWARHCRCCPQCWSCPCDACCAGGVCDAMPCRCEDGADDEREEDPDDDW